MFVYLDPLVVLFMTFGLFLFFLTFTILEYLYLFKWLILLSGLFTHYHNAEYKSSP
jgi:hypothetical protein